MRERPKWPVFAPAPEKLRVRHLNAGAVLQQPHPEIGKAQPGHSILRSLDFFQRRLRDGSSDGDTGGEAGISRLVPGKQSRCSGLPPHLFLSQAHSAQRGTNHKFFAGRASWDDPLHRPKHWCRPAAECVHLRGLAATTE